MAGNGDGTAERLSCSERLCHGGGEGTAFASVAVLEQSHGPCQLAQGQYFDLIGERDQLRSEAVLLVGRERGDWCSQRS